MMLGAASEAVLKRHGHHQKSHDFCIMTDVVTVYVSAYCKKKGRRRRERQATFSAECSDTHAQRKVLWSLIGVRLVRY